MEKQLSDFIWRESKTRQIRNALLVLFTIPVTYVLFELPKQIVDSIVSENHTQYILLGLNLESIDFVITLASIYMITSFASGMLKMRSNMTQGLLAEELMAKIRVTLATKIEGFSKDDLNMISQGELVSLITSELEPLGEVIGGYLARPIYLVSQIAVACVFLFMQSALIASVIVALIPVQFWFVPRLQRQVLIMSRERIRAVRGLADSIASFTQLIQSGEDKYRKEYKKQKFLENPSVSEIEERVLRIKEIRGFIYQKKFFLKFLNNSLESLNPFFIFLFGGSLAVQGEISIGAIVACLLAYTGLSDSVQGLLTYYNQIQDMNNRWEITHERFRFYS